MNTKPIKHRLLEHRIIVGDCWLWSGSTSLNGYGHIAVVENGRRINKLVHRVSYAEFVEKDVENHLILHRPGCNRRNCFNPLHLYKGDYSDNTRDAVGIGLHTNAAKQTCPQGHPYDVEYTHNRRWNNVSGRPWRHRVCSICRKENAKKYRQAKQTKQTKGETTL